jgi:hypothetical protein
MNIENVNLQLANSKHLALKKLSDECLLNQMEKFVYDERQILTVILHHLREIDRRRLFSALKFGSLYEYAVKKLGYSEDQAYRRIAAMRLLKEIPELEEKINAGSLTLTHMGMAQSFFKKEEKLSKSLFSKSLKIALLQKLENKPTREAEKIVFALSSDESKKVSEKIRAVAEDQIEIKFRANIELSHKIHLLKSLMAHSHPGISLEELFTRLCDLGLEKLGLKLERKPASPSKTAAPRKLKISQAAIYREVKSRRHCERCGSNYALEMDHITPRALGGSNKLKNLRLLCRSCNQRAAIEVFGISKMEKYLSRPMPT